MSGTSNPIPPQKKTYFREYIGVKPYPELDDFPDYIINPMITEFHFILGFATEKYVKEECKKGESSFTCYKGTGEFEHTWNIEYFGPENVKKLKKERSNNVKVVISIGGRGKEKPFNPAVDEETWIKNAVDSLKQIFEEYNDPVMGNLIDGIDINYEIIDMKSCDGEPHKKDCFPLYIGEVIRTLKNYKHLHINYISIAPSEESQPHYLKLYLINRFQLNINFVDYQFYNQLKPVSSVEQFVKIYNFIVGEYQSDDPLFLNKVPLVLPGVSTDPVDKIVMPIQTFIDGCDALIKQYDPRKKHPPLQGIFVWNANDSVRQDFSLEKHLQNLLTGFLAD